MYPTKMTFPFPETKPLTQEDVKNALPYSGDTLCEQFTGRTTFPLKQNRINRAKEIYNIKGVILD